MPGSRDLHGERVSVDAQGLEIYVKIESIKGDNPIVLLFDVKCQSLIFKQR